MQSDNCLKSFHKIKGAGQSGLYTRLRAYLYALECNSMCSLMSLTNKTLIAYEYARVNYEILKLYWKCNISSS